MFRSYLLSIKLGFSSITNWVTALKECPLYAIVCGFIPDDVPGIGTFYDFFDRIWCSDCNIGWDSSRNSYFNGYHLYMFVASDSFSDLPVFPILERGSRHDMLSFLHSFFTMKTWLPEFNVAKLLLDSAHDADAVYRYCNDQNIRHLIDFNKGNTGKRIYKDTFTLDENGVPVCKKGLKMHSQGIEHNRKRHKYRCPLVDNGSSCDTPCSDSPYGRVVHTSLDDDPRLFTIPARGSKQWKEEYNARTSVERSNKREKEDYKLEDGKHRSSKMWYCRLYGIMMFFFSFSLIYFSMFNTEKVPCSKRTPHVWRQ